MNTSEGEKKKNKSKQNRYKITTIHSSLLFQFVFRSKSAWLAFYVQSISNVWYSCMLSVLYSEMGSRIYEKPQTIQPKQNNHPLQYYTNCGMCSSSCASKWHTIYSFFTLKNFRYPFPLLPLPPHIQMCSIKQTQFFAYFPFLGFSIRLQMD